MLTPRCLICHAPVMGCAGLMVAACHECQREAARMFRRGFRNQLGAIPDADTPKDRHPRLVSRSADHRDGMAHPEKQPRRAALPALRRRH
jgi:hypothetical protein